ncbi:hypothetical protein DFH28DRAFT_898776 [Melampsora americana]|nr:hypothetical protein DFH28DRAFT_898776 [Melampsora americana]
MVRENVQNMEKSSSSVPNHFQPYDTSNSRTIFSYLSSEDDNLRLKASESYIKVLQSSKKHPYLKRNATLSQSKPSFFQASKEPSILSEIGSSRSQSNQINQISPIYHLSVYQKIHQWQSNLSNHDINPNLPSPGRELKFKEYSIWH